MIDFVAGFCIGVLSVLLILVAKNLTKNKKEDGLSEEFMAMINSPYDPENYFKPEGTE